jgi:hypothetical protein
MGLSNVRGGAGGLVAVLAGVLVPAGCATSGVADTPVVPATPLAAVDYYPLQAGWKWSYDIEKDGQHILSFYSVMERIGDSVIVQAGEDRLLYAITPLGIARREGPVLGDFLIKDPIAAGASWPVAQGKAQIAAIGQSVTVPAGTFTGCVVVEETRSEPNRIVRTTYAPGVGPVQVELQIQDGGKFVTTTRATLRGVNKPGQDPLAVAFIRR